MAARKGERDLERAVRDPGFTPGARDAKGLVALLDSNDDELVRDVERALVRVGPTLVDIARAAMPGASERTRARLVRAVGALPSREEDAAMGLLVESLSSKDARVVRYAASALGKARGRAADAEAALVKAWGDAKSDDVRKAIADALGKVGGDAAKSALAAAEPGDDELKKVVAKARLRLERTAVRGREESAIDGDAGLGRPWPVVFRCRAGLESILVEELGERWSPRAIDAERVQGVLRGGLASAWQARTAIDFALLLEGGTGGAEKGAIDLLTSDAAARALRTFTRGPIRYRLAFEGGGHRRALVHRIATEVHRRRPELINDPTSSPWEALVRDRDGLVSIELTPRLADPRFDYRVADVPAASHPTIAAALARVAGVKDDDVVWDPFVGSGLELIERARLGAYRALHGTDVEEAALEAARANLARAGVEGVHLVHGDSTVAAPKKVTLAITNPPMGRRVARGELAMLLDRIVHRVGAALAPGGRFVWLSPLPERTRARFADAGLTIELARSVDMGGFRAELQRATKG
jgi:23S rRNA G2445 N2-methylase RlmL